MTGLFIVLHTIICVGLVMIILMQSGRGGGLTEAFASAESVFGAKTNEFLIRITTIFSIGFLITCLTLAFLSLHRDKSLMPAPTAEQTQEDASKVVQKIIDEAKKNTIQLDLNKGAVNAVNAELPAEPVQEETPQP